MTLDRAELARRAEVDPWALHGQLAAGDPVAVESLAGDFYRAAGEVAGAQEAGARSTRYLAGGYQVSGVAIIDASAEVRDTARHLGDAHRGMVAIATELMGVGDDLALARGRSDRELRTLDAALARIDGDARVAAGAAVHDPEAHRAVLAAGDGHAVAAVRSAGVAVAGWVDGYESRLAAATRRLAALGYLPPEALDAAPAAVPATGSAPDTVAQWWRGLTSAEQQALVQSQAGRLASLQGLPGPVLDAVNRRRLSDHLAALQAELAAVPAGSGWDADALRRARLLRLYAHDEGILAALEDTSRRVGAPVLLLRYAPLTDSSPGGAAVAIGDPDHATDTAVVVPGTGSTPTGLGDLTDSKGIPLYQQMRSSAKSVVVWLDGPEPHRAMPGWPQLVPDAAWDTAAERSAPQLAADLAGLDAAHRAAMGSGAHVTAVGHSYGTYILGRALTAGASRHVTDAVFTGSPGVGVDHASDLGLDPAHVWSAQAGDDPILLVRNRFTPHVDGLNPEESGFGARHLDVSGAHGHGGYFQGRSLEGIAHVADGNYGAVHTVPAPDFRGPRELILDALDGAELHPADTLGRVGADLWHGDPAALGRDTLQGILQQATDTEHLVQDGWQTAEDLGALVSRGLDSVPGLADHVLSGPPDLLLDTVPHVLGPAVGGVTRVFDEGEGAVGSAIDLGKALIFGS